MQAGVQGQPMGQLVTEAELNSSKTAGCPGAIILNIRTIKHFKLLQLQSWTGL